MGNLLTITIPLDGDANIDEVLNTPRKEFESWERRKGAKVRVREGRYGTIDTY